MPLTADRNTSMKDGEEIVVPMTAGAVAFAGGIAVVAADGYAAPGSTALALIFLGRFEEAKDNTTGADGAVSVRIRRKKAFKWKNSATDAITQADFGKVCFIVDDETVARTDGTTTRSECGVIVGVDSDGIWVE